MDDGFVRLEEEGGEEAKKKSRSEFKAVNGGGNARKYGGRKARPHGCKRTTAALTAMTIVAVP
jgi:hypothetical protein